MRTKRNTSVIVVIAITAGLLTAAWSTMSDIEPAPVLVPSGVYTGLFPGDMAFAFTTIEIPMDPAGNTMVFIMRNDNQAPTLGDPNPPLSEVDHMTDYVGNMIRTGPNTWDYTGIAYGTKKVEGQARPEIIYVGVVQGTATSTDDGSAFTNEGTFALYMPEQDVNGDGCPDANQEPVYCSPPHVFTIKRMPVTSPCVPTPVPEG